MEEEYIEQYRIVVDGNQKPMRIDKFLMGKVERVTRNKLQAAIRSGAVTVDEQQVKPNFKVRPHQVIVLVLPKSMDQETGIIPENIPLDIRYEDEDILVVFKPTGMVVHPGLGNKSGTLANAVAYHLRNNPEMPLLPGNSADRPGLVHRIDKHTSGLLVLAKTDFAMAHLAKQFFDHTIERKYIALVWGNMEEEQGTIIGNIARHPTNRMWMTVFPEGDHGKHAVTHFKVTERFLYTTLIECQLETGRTHQIRVHLKHLGHTLFNDERYGGDRILKGTVFTKYKQFVHNAFDILPRTALHAKSLGFVHPTSGENMYFEAPLPDDMAECIEKWRGYSATR